MFSGKCLECVYSAVDITGHRYCLLHGWLVGDSDVCSQYVSREGVTRFALKSIFKVVGE